MNFDTIKRNYERKLWSNAMVAIAVRKGVLTPGEYQTITGDTYAIGNTENVKPSTSNLSK